MDSVLSLSLIIIFVFLSVFEMIYFNEFFNGFIEKNKIWVKAFVKMILMILVEVFMYSWLPGRLGMEMSFLDGELILADGALIANFGKLMIILAICIGIALLKYSWGGIRKRYKMNVKAVLLYILCTAVPAFIGANLFENPYVADFSGQEKMGYFVFAVLLIFALIFIFGDDEKKEKK